MDRPKLNDVEARVLGVLVEKAFTTPDQYPLTLNAILNGCNQKSNRAPLTSYIEAEIIVGLQGLVPKHLAGKVATAGARVPKYRHSAFQSLQVDGGEMAVLAELMMRGPQTPGELRARVHRMVATPTLPELQDRIEALMTKGLVASVAPAAGSRAGRYAQLLAPGLHEALAAASPASEVPAARSTGAAGTGAGSGLSDRVAKLEGEVKELRGLIDGLLAELT